MSRAAVDHGEDQQEDATNVGEPRRGGRVRKQVDRFEPETSKKSRKANEDEGEDEASSDSDEEDAQPARKKRAPAGTKSKTATTSKSSAPRKKKPAKVLETNGDADESQIKNDCPLFNALLSADVALQPLIEEWVDTYQSTANDETSEKASVHELVTFFIRCCGLNSEIEEDQAIDVDGVVDTLEDIQTESVKTTSAVYPLIARTKEAKTFRTNLALFVPHLIKMIFLTNIPYETEDSTPHSTPLLSLILNWLHSMSSSPLRPIRHTSTHIALKICSALCDVAVEVSKDLSLKQRQRDAESKKGGVTGQAKKKVAAMEEKVTESREKKEKLEEYMQEIFDVLFVHRVRDSDALIRKDCLGELGVWAKKYGEMFIDNQHLSYFARGCNDPDTKARLETVKALPSLLSTESNVNRARTVLLRLAPRLIEMSLRDVDLHVRTNALHVITEIGKTGLLEDEDEDQRAIIARLVFDSEPRIRKAAAGFVRDLWEQKLESLTTQWASVKGNKRKRAAGVSEEDMEQRLGYKALAQLLLETSKSLDESANRPGPSKRVETSGSIQAGRAIAAVEALWDTFEELQEWEKLVEYLLLDHSEASDMWLLEEDEEGLLLQVLVECIKMDDSDEEDDVNERTTTLMNVLPRLFKQHQADSERMTGILAIPEQMNLVLYQSMGKTAAYEGLWDDITKQFLQHIDLNLLTAAIKAVVHMTNNGPENINKTKLAELDETVFNSLREAINGEDVFSMSMDEDRLANIQAILLRISLLQRSRDIVDVMQDEEGGQSSGWEIVLAFVQRGEVGYKEEAKVVEHAIQIVFLHLTWLLKNFTEEDAQDVEKVDDLKAKRDRARDSFVKLAMRDGVNPVESVVKQAFTSYLNLHVLFSGRGPKALPAAKAAPLRIEDEVQHRLGGAFLAAAERYASERESMSIGKDEQDVDALLDAEKAQHELVFLQLVSVFVGAIRCSVLDVEQAREPLSHYGRFGPTYDAIVKKLVDPLRDEGIYNNEATTVQHIAAASLTSNFDFYLDTADEVPTCTIALAKLIASAFIVQGNHFVVLRQLHPDDVHDFHVTCIDIVCRKLTSAVRTLKSAKSKSAKDHASSRIAQTLTFFKALIHTLGPVRGPDAVKIRDHLESAVEGTGAVVSAARQWDGYRMYEKRLMGIASKDAEVRVVIQPAKRKVQARDGDDAGTEASDEEEEVPAKRTPTKKNTQADLAEEGEDDDEEAPAAIELGEEIEEEVEDQAGDAADEQGDLDIDEAFEELDKRKRARTNDAEGGDGIDVELDLDLDLELDLDLPDTQDRAARARSESVDLPPATKKRKTVKRY